MLPSKQAFLLSLYFSAISFLYATAATSFTFPPWHLQAVLFCWVLQFPLHQCQDYLGHQVVLDCCINYPVQLYGSIPEVSLPPFLMDLTTRTCQFHEHCLLAQYLCQVTWAYSRYTHSSLHKAWRIPSQSKIFSLECKPSIHNGLSIRRAFHQWKDDLLECYFWKYHQMLKYWLYFVKKESLFCHNLIKDWDF